MVTVAARLLLGWMPQSEALDFLLNKCVFDEALSREKAIETWESYRAMVATMPPRPCTIPGALKMTRNEQAKASAVKRNPPKMQDKLHDVIKVNPRGMVIHQFFINTDRAGEYRQRMHNERQRLKCCFGLDAQVPAVKNEGKTRIITLPHWEYELQQFKKPDGGVHINLQEWPRLLSAVKLKDRMLLWGGYHRTYALLSQTEPDGLDDPPLVSLISSPAVDAFFSNASLRPEVRELVLGDKPAFFGDFFNNALVMSVALRKQGRQLRVDLTTNTSQFGFFDAES